MFHFREKYDRLVKKVKNYIDQEIEDDKNRIKENVKLETENQLLRYLLFLNKTEEEIQCFEKELKSSELKLKKSSRKNSKKLGIFRKC